MICFSVEFNLMLISVESKETINSVDNPYVLICKAIYKLICFSYSEIGKEHICEYAILQGAPSQPVLTAWTQTVAHT